jgi:hypothetical protein
MLGACLPRCLPREIARSGNRTKPTLHRRLVPLVAARPVSDIADHDIPSGLQRARLLAEGRPERAA